VSEHRCQPFVGAERPRLDGADGDTQPLGHLGVGQLLEVTHTEVAERLGVPIGTVKSRSFRAHKRLASMLGHLREAAG